jgi:hypothetical protein
MDSLLIQALKASRDPRDCRKTMDALRRIGFGDDAFPALHHQHGSAVTFYKFSEGVQRYRDDKNNHRVHQRLAYVLLSCPDGVLPSRKSFQALAEEAYRLIPPIA